MKIKSKLVLKFFFLLSLSFGLGVFSVSASELVHYQKVKNVTQYDDPRGDNIALANQGDEIHYLILLRNQSAANETYTLRDTLPPDLVYQSGSAQIYYPGQGRWADVDNNKPFPLENFTIDLSGKSWVYLKFYANVKTELPNANLTESNLVEIFDAKGEKIISSLTKVIIPNAPLQISEGEEAKLSEQELRHVNKILEEEAQAIEVLFSTKTTGISQNKIRETLVGVLILAAIFIVVRRRFYRKNKK